MAQRLALAFGVGFLSGSVLMVELLLTRLFSVGLYYHFAFMAVSVALLGLGTGGLLVYMNRHRFAPETMPRWLNSLGLALMLCTFLTLSVILNLRVPTHISVDSALRLLLVFAVSTLPFLFAGAMLSLIVWRFAATIHRIYFFDLVGAALGSLAIIPALEWIGAPNAVLLAIIFAGLSAALLSWTTGGGKGLLVRAGLAALAVAVLLGFNLDGKLLDLRYAKGITTADEVYARWNAISRVCLHPREKDYSIRIDCDASTLAANFDFWNGDRAALAERFSHISEDLAHTLRPGGKTFIIGSGGGLDVSRALAHGSPRIVAVEINPLIAVDLMRNHLREYSHRLFERPEVELVVDDARSAVRRSDEQFDVMQATVIDTWASTAAGAFALTENYLYTVDAFVDYLQHLSPQGILTITRHEFVPPKHGLRLMSLGRAAMERMGIPSPAQNFLVVQNLDGGDVSVLMKRTPFTPDDIQKAHEFLARNPGLTPLYIPGEPKDNQYNALLRAPTLAAFTQQYVADVGPIGDDRPFFFFTTRWSRLWSMFSSSSKEELRNNLALFMLVVLTAGTTIAVLMLMSLPRWFGRREERRSAPIARWSYFLAIGVAYIIVEIALIQTFILFMGHPTYGITVVVFSLLVGSGLGSRWSGRIQSVHRAAVWIPVALALLLVVAQLFLYPSVLHAGQGLSRLVRGLISVGVIMPFGFLMGMPFPTGVRASSEREGDLLPWLWSANAAGSVLGSVVAIVLAINIGVPRTGALGGLCYLFAALAAFASLRSATPPSAVQPPGRA